MATTFTPRTGAALPATGEDAGTWGDLVNNETFDMFDQAIAGVTDLSMPDADYTMTGVGGVADQGRSPVVYVTGALTAARKLLIPELYASTSKLYTIINRTSGGAIGYTLKVNSVTGDGSFAAINVPPMGCASILVDANRCRLMAPAFGNTIAVVSFVGTTVSINASLNVDSVSKTATGTYLITFTNAAPETTFIVSGSATGPAGNLTLTQEYSYSVTTTTVKVVTLNASGTPTDCAMGSVLITG